VPPHWALDPKGPNPICVRYRYSIPWPREKFRSPRLLACCIDLASAIPHPRRFLLRLPPHGFFGSSPLQPPSLRRYASWHRLRRSAVHPFVAATTSVHRAAGRRRRPRPLGLSVRAFWEVPIAPKPLIDVCQEYIC
jgi:hypothetical protein